MKKQSLLISTAIVFAIVITSCGGGGIGSSNKYLGKLPGLAKKYTTEIEELEKKAEEATDMDKAFKYAKEAENLEKEADKAIEDYVAENEFNEIVPFTTLSDVKYEVKEVKVSGASIERAQFIAKVRVTDDIKNKYGGLERYLFVYVKAVDKNGEILGEPTVFASPMGKKIELVKGAELEIKGGIKHLKDLGNLDKIVNITKEEYDNLK